jgi:hypothetical protein
MHPTVMLSKGYFKGSELAQMSNGTYCIIRPLGLVKGGKGMRHHENLLTLNVRGMTSKLVHMLRHVARLFESGRLRKPPGSWVARAHE